MHGMALSIFDIENRRFDLRVAVGRLELAENRIVVVVTLGHERPWTFDLVHSPSYQSTILARITHAHINLRKRIQTVSMRSHVRDSFLSKFVQQLSLDYHIVKMTTTTYPTAVLFPVHGQFCGGIRSMHGMALSILDIENRRFDRRVAVGRLEIAENRIVVVLTLGHERPWTFDLVHSPSHQSTIPARNTPHTSTCESESKPYRCVLTYATLSCRSLSSNCRLSVSTVENGCSLEGYKSGETNSYSDTGTCGRHLVLGIPFHLQFGRLGVVTAKDRYIRSGWLEMGQVVMLYGGRLSIGPTNLCVEV
ncbi:hypothetical protein PsorP6_009866 [Peronosclerospora sorghi]|uniref:Uncharacterized protein n=1 Tax=Peronosclerospora sorghi TaxID=230839 RepID=A0ACC0VYW3_9STRA|nr:hypothetical protein PsorP6_009866 [Peronosclerospora sorghi]